MGKAVPMGVLGLRVPLLSPGEVARKPQEPRNKVKNELSLSLIQS